MTATSLVFLFGRILFGGFFIVMAGNHFMNWKQMAGYAASKKIPAPQAAVIGTGFLLLLGGLGVLLGIYIHIALILLIIFLVPVTFTMHSFWKDTDPMTKMGNMVNFQKNLALLGAVLMLLTISATWPKVF